MTQNTTTPDPIEREALLPCPFCGSGPAKSIQNASFSGVELIDWHGKYFVNCGTCGTEGAKEKTTDAAVAAWNRRALPAAQDGAEVDQLQAEVERLNVLISALGAASKSDHAKSESYRTGKIKAEAERDAANARAERAEAALSSLLVDWDDCMGADRSTVGSYAARATLALAMKANRAALAQEVPE